MYLHAFNSKIYVNLLLVVINAPLFCSWICSPDWRSCAL